MSNALSLCVNLKCSHLHASVYYDVGTIVIIEIYTVCVRISFTQNN